MKCIPGINTGLRTCGHKSQGPKEEFITITLTDIYIYRICNTYIHTYINIFQIRCFILSNNIFVEQQFFKKKRHQLEKEKRGEYGRFWREEREGGNGIIIVSKYK